MFLVVAFFRQPSTTTTLPTAFQIYSSFPEFILPFEDFFVCRYRCEDQKRTTLANIVQATGLKRGQDAGAGGGHE